MYCERRYGKTKMTMVYLVHYLSREDATLGLGLSAGIATTYADLGL